MIPPANATIAELLPSLPEGMAEKYRGRVKIREEKRMGQIANQMVLELLLKLQRHISEKKEEKKKNREHENTGAKKHESEA